MSSCLFLDRRQYMNVYKRVLKILRSRTTNRHNLRASIFANHHVCLVLNKLSLRIKGYHRHALNEQISIYITDKELNETESHQSSKQKWIINTFTPTKKDVKIGSKQLLIIHCLSNNYFFFKKKINKEIINVLFSITV